MRRNRSVLVLGLLASVAAVAAFASDGEILYQKQSPYTTIYVTENDQGLRVLQFERYGSRQSVVKLGDPDHLELPYARTMLVPLALVPQPERILVVGLGGGTIPSFLHKHYPQATIDVVDIDPDVVDVAKRFFGFQEDDTMRAFIADGRQFIEQSKDPYDLIFLDAFSSENIPYHLATRQFLQAVRRALTPRGVCIGNVWSRYSNPLYDSMVRTYQDVFDQLYIFDVRAAGNKILVALPRDEPIDRDVWIRQARQVSRTKDFRFDLGNLVRYGFRHADQEVTAGRVLTDDHREVR